MSKVNVIIELNHSKKLENNAFAAMEAESSVGLDMNASQQLSVVNYDTSFAAVMLPNLSQVDFPTNELFDTNASFAVDDSPNFVTQAEFATDGGATTRTPPQSLRAGAWLGSHVLGSSIPLSR